MKLEEIIDGLLELLNRYNYNEETIKFYMREWNKLKNFLLKQYNDTDFSIEKGMLYLENQYGIVTNYNKEELSRQRVQLIRVIHLLEDYQLHGVLTRRYYSSKNPIKLNEYYDCALKKFSEEINHTELSNSTKMHYIRITEMFMDFLMQKHINDLHDINLAICNDYICTLAGYKFKTVEQQVCGMRYLLRYLKEKEIIFEDISSKITMPNISKTAKIPQGWTAEEVRKILDVIDTNSPLGKRDYAMILLAAVLGLRIGDIKRLTFSNFDWKAKKLNLVQHKTHQPLSLDIPPKVGWAVIDYIKNGRPHVEDTQVIFIKHLAPFAPFDERNNLNYTFAKYVHKAGLSLKKGQRVGYHSLRHSAASLMLENGAEITMISEILGHSDTDVTSIYLKTDIKKLSECVLSLDFEDYEEAGD